jgi:hypothetical protein
MKREYTKCGYQKHGANRRLAVSVCLSGPVEAALVEWGKARGMTRSAAGAEIIARALKVPVEER